MIVPTDAVRMRGQPDAGARFLILETKGYGLRPADGGEGTGAYSIGAIRAPNSCPPSSSHVQAYCAKLRWTWISNSGDALT